MKENEELRDFFAGLAMLGFIFRGAFRNDEIARQSFDLAEQMIEERNKRMSKQKGT